jgi:hypothetical protein
MGMKQQDKVLVAFLLTLKMAGSEIKLPEAQLEFIIKGPGIKTEIPVEEMTQVEKDELDVRLRMSMNHPQYQKLAEVWKGFLTPKMWEALVQLSGIAPFNDPDKNFIEHLVKYHEEWRRFINHSTEDSNENLPGDFSKFLTKEEKEYQRNMIENMKRN